MPQIEFSIKISPNELKKYYSGTAKSVSVIAKNGKRLQFPANLLLSHVSHSGVSGHFSLEYSNEGKAKKLKKLDRPSKTCHFSKQV